MGSRAQGEGFGPNYELPNHTAYCETCASIANVFWNYRMFLATGESKYVDVYERALYNGVLSGVSLSGDKFFYDNPLESMGGHERQRWFGCACCPGNITRFLASVSGYQYATQQNDVYVNLYIQGKADLTTTDNQVILTQTTEYPWNGAVSIQVNPKEESKFAIRLRIPGWLTDRPVASSLYAYTDAPKDYHIRVNGQAADYLTGNGYATLLRTWKAGDVIELELPMEVRRIQANEQVKTDVGFLALERGPIVYCLEGKDQPDSTVFNKFIAPTAPVAARYDAGLLNGVVVLDGTAQEVGTDGTVTAVPFRAIPYSTWNNRGADQMEVWIASAKEYATPTPQPTIASRARTFSLQAAIQKDAPESAAQEVWAWGVNDQWEPQSSSDISKPYFYWWLKKGSLETLAYEFDRPYRVSGVSVYWLDLDHYDGNFRVPQSWKLYYKAGSTWKEVEAQSEYGIKKDCYNTLKFKPVETTGLKIAAQLQENASGGILEWKVNE